MAPRFKCSRRRQTYDENFAFIATELWHGVAAEFCIYSSLYDEMKIKKEKRIEDRGDGDNELFLRISRS